MTLPERRSTTTPERWDSRKEYEQVADRIRRVLEDTFGAAEPLLTAAPVWSPPVDVEETDDAFIITAEVPGAKREDVNIELVANELTISGEIKERERVGLVRRRTRRTGRFEYRLSLPTTVDGDKIEATLHDGVLTVRAPKVERAQRRKIDVKSER
jgi:HSP20 family protein